MLGPFILPVAQFDTAARGLGQFDKEYPLRVSALGPRTDTADAFIHSLAAAMDAIAAFRAGCGETVVVEQFEMPLPDEVDADLMETMRPFLDAELATFLEASVKNAGRVIEMMAGNNSNDPVPRKPPGSSSGLAA
jgi:hypothetical protein